MTRKYLYLFLSVIGFVVPYYFFISFLLAHGLNARIFFQQLFGTLISTFFAVDLLLSGIVFIVFLHQDARRYSMKHQWIYLVALFMVGVSFALPMFLWARESHLEGRGQVGEI
jgi:hypothetical protein